MKSFLKFSAPILQPKKNLPRINPLTGIRSARYNFLNMKSNVSTPLRILKSLRNSSVPINNCCIARSWAFMDKVTELTLLWILAWHRSLFGHPAHWSLVNETWNCCDLPPVYPHDFGSYPAGHLTTFVPSSLNTKSARISSTGLPNKSVLISRMFFSVARSWSVSYTHLTLPTIYSV